MRHNRRGEPIGRESCVYLYGASRREVCRKVDPVGVTSAVVRDQTSTSLDFWPRSVSERHVESYAATERAHASGSAQIEIVEFRSRSDGVRAVAANRPKSSSLSSSLPAIDALRRLQPQPGDQREYRKPFVSSRNRNQTVNSLIATESEQS